MQINRSIMKVLAGCEYSGVIREAFRTQGHDAWSCDLEETLVPGQHIVGDVLDHLNEGWDLAIFDPKRKHLACHDIVESTRALSSETAGALELVQALWSAPIPRIAIIGKDGHIRRLLGQPDQRIQPHYYGEDASEWFSLWLKGLPCLQGTRYVPGQIRYASPDGRWIHVWGNQRHKQGRPHVETIPRRGVTYPGIARAMADQWCRLLCSEFEKTKF